MPEARMPPAMPLPEETPLPKTPARQLNKSSAAVTMTDDYLNDSLFEAMDTFSLKTPTAPCLGVQRKSSSSKSEISASNPTNSTATLSLFSSVSSNSNMSLGSPFLADLDEDLDEELLWLEESRASSKGGTTRTELVSNLAGLLKRCVKC